MILKVSSKQNDSMKCPYFFHIYWIKSVSLWLFKWSKLSTVSLDRCLLVMCLRSVCIKFGHFLVENTIAVRHFKCIFNIKVNANTTVVIA